MISVSLAAGISDSGYWRLIFKTAFGNWGHGGGEKSKLWPQKSFMKFLCFIFGHRWHLCAKCGHESCSRCEAVPELETQLSDLIA